MKSYTYFFYLLKATHTFRTAINPLQCKPTEEVTFLDGALAVDVTPKKRRRRRRRKTASAANDSSSCTSGEGQASPPRKQTKTKRRSRRRRRKNSAKNAEEDVSLEEQARFLALDCEMVGVGPGAYKSALARVCIVDWNEEVVFDTFVKVAEPVTDYRTFVSGVREEDLTSDEAMEFDECRAKVREIIEGKVVVGHALKNDFQAMKLSHPWYDTRDTAKYTPFLRKCEWTGALKLRRLRELVQEKLGREIQCEGEEHCPYEDASATLALYKVVRKKWEKVMTYKYNKTQEITQQTSSSASELSTEDYENILEFFETQ